MESVRVATAADRERCDELLEAARAEAAARRGGATLLDEAVAAAPGADGAAGWLRGRPGDPAAGEASRVLLVGEFAGAVVGVGAASVFPPGTATGPQPPGNGEPRRVGRIAWCYVDPPARGVGVGTALLRALVDWCGAQGCRDVEAVALPGDRATKQLYEAAGLKARLLVMHRHLG